MRLAKYIIVRRPFDDDPDRGAEPRWEKIGYADSIAAAKRFVLRPTHEDGSPADLAVGDLLCVMGLEYVTPQLFPDRATELYVVGSGGIFAAPRVPSGIARSGGKTWLLGWEGQLAQADMMLDYAYRARVANSRLVMSAANCAETAVGGLADSDREHDGLIVAASKAYALGSGKAGDVLSMVSQGINFESDIYFHSSAHAAFNYVGKTIVNGEYAGHCARMTAAHLGQKKAGVSWGAARSMAERDALLEMSELVRKWIPLSVIILAKLGEQIPINPSKLSP